MRKSSLTSKSSRNQDLKATRKALNKIPVHKFGDVDSLSFLKEKKSENIDDKFKLLKTELHSLFVESKAEASESLSSNHTQSNQIQNHGDYKKEQNVVTSVNPSSSKFSDWLNETIEKIEVESSNSNANKKLDCDESLPSTAKLGFKSKYNMTLLPNHKVERLLYKSFLLQNLGVQVLSSSDESEPEQLKSNKIRRLKKKQSRRASSRSFSSSFPKKRKRTLLDNDIEIIHLKGDFKKNRNNKIQYVDFEVDSYDWNEPFCTEKASDSSDLEIIEDDQYDVHLNKRNEHNTEMNLTKSYMSTNTQEQNSSNDTKRSWECPICFEGSQGQSIVATQCGHIFCKICLEKHNTTQGKFCPTCRVDISDKPPITLFNF